MFHTCSCCSCWGCCSCCSSRGGRRCVWELRLVEKIKIILYISLILELHHPKYFRTFYTSCIATIITRCSTNDPYYMTIVTAIVSSLCIGLSNTTLFTNQPHQSFTFACSINIRITRPITIWRNITTGTAVVGSFRFRNTIYLLNVRPYVPNIILVTKRIEKLILRFDIDNEPLSRFVCFASPDHTVVCLSRSTSYLVNFPLSFIMNWKQL